MDSNFLCFELNNNSGCIYVKPGEITSIGIAPEGGSRIVTKQNQVYYVIEPVADVHSMIRIYFQKLKGEF